MIISVQLLDCKCRNVQAEPVGRQMMAVAVRMRDTEAAANGWNDLGTGDGKDQPPDYAAALQKAKRYVRQQKKWSSPYYWGTFVLVGPK